MATTRAKMAATSCSVSAPKPEHEAIVPSYTDTAHRCSGSGGEYLEAMYPSEDVADGQPPCSSTVLMAMPQAGERRASGSARESGLLSDRSRPRAA
jgi:hypothetical protein